jgi:hypothetical protein
MKTVKFVSNMNMKNTKILHTKRWDYRLYDVDGKKILTVVFFASFVDYERSFYLTESEYELDYDALSE